MIFYALPYRVIVYHALSTVWRRILFMLVLSCGVQRAGSRWTTSRQRLSRRSPPGTGSWKPADCGDQPTAARDTTSPSSCPTDSASTTWSSSSPTCIRSCSDNSSTTASTLSTRWVLATTTASVFFSFSSFSSFSFFSFSSSFSFSFPLPQFFLKTQVTWGEISNLYKRGSGIVPSTFD